MPDEPKQKPPENSEAELRSLLHEMHALAVEMAKAARAMNRTVNLPNLLISLAALVMASVGLWKVTMLPPMTQTQEVNVDRPETLDEAHIRMIEEERERLNEDLSGVHSATGRD